MTGVRRKRRRPRPTYREESALLRDGVTYVAGVDEVGRGCLAGPVVAGAAILEPDPRGRWLSEIRDSKQLTPRQRTHALGHLRRRALAISTGAASASEIDRVGIVGATRLAMERAIQALAVTPDFLLLDAIALPDVDIRQKSIVHGDALCVSIAAASVVAKVARDELMETHDSTYPEYGFGRHKGYGTPQHMDALRTLGPCELHRYSFAPVQQRSLW